MLRSSSVLLLAALLAACNGSVSKNAAATEPPTLLGRDWQVVSVGALQAETAADHLSWLRIQPEEAQTSVNGYTGCNSMRGSARLQDNTLSFGPIAITKRYCPQTAAIESALLAGLREVQSWSIVGEQLQLLNANGAVVITAVVKDTKVH